MINIVLRLSINILSVSKFVGQISIQIKVSFTGMILFALNAFIWFIFQYMYIAIDSFVIRKQSFCILFGKKILQKNLFDFFCVITIIGAPAVIILAISVTVSQILGNLLLLNAVWVVIKHTCFVFICQKIKLTFEILLVYVVLIYSTIIQWLLLYW
jgi:hypothetical protein